MFHPCRLSIRSEATRHTPPSRMSQNHNEQPERSRKDGQKRDDAQRRDWRHLSSLFEQLPPHAIEAEMSLLGSILIDPQVISDVVLVLASGDDFYKPAHGTIFDTMVELYDTHSAVDVVQLHQMLLDRATLESVGGLPYLVDLANAVPSASSAIHYAKLVRSKALIRNLIDAAGDILYDAYHSPEEAQGILERSEQAIFKLAQQTERSTAESLQSLLTLTMARLEANEGKDPHRHRHGIH